MKKLLFALLVTLIIVPISSANAASIGAYKRPIGWPFSWVGDHTYMCLSTGACYGYDGDSIVHSSGSAVQGGTWFFGISVPASNTCVAQVVNTWMGSYGYDAVCHQNTNRGLYFTGQSLGSAVNGYSLTKALFGVYGKTWSPTMVAPVCQQYRSSALAAQTVTTVGDTSLKGREASSNETTRNKYYTQKIVEANQKTAIQPQTDGLTDVSSRIANEFQYTIYEILGSDYSASKVEEVRKLHTAMLRQDETNEAKLQKGVITKAEFEKSRNTIVTAWLHRVNDVLGTKDFEAVFSMKASEIDTAWSGLQKGLN